MASHSIAPPTLRYVWLLITIILQFGSTAAQMATYIVHMDLSAMPKAFSDHQSWFTATISATEDHSSISVGPPNLIYTYDNVMHGFSARLSPSQLGSLQKSLGYVSSYPDMHLSVDTTHTFEFLHLEPDSGIWPASDYGEDVIIGVIDTGIWPESKSFMDHGMNPMPPRWKGTCEQGTHFNSSICNNKLIGARFFNKGLLANVPNITFTVNSPRDTDGHGTHTASTAAGAFVERASYFGYAAGTARGMAPRARLAVYKVLWDEGSSIADILAGIDQAISDGVDVISISLGRDLPLYNDPIAIASYAAMEKGIFVASSAGNRGPQLGTLHNGTPWLLTVGASTVDREFAGIITLGNGISVTGASLYPTNSSLSQLPLVFMGACNSSNLLKDVGYKIVVCEDTTDSLYDQIGSVSSAKVAGGLFISNTSFLGRYIRFTFPAAIIKPQEAQTILGYMKAGSNPIASMQFQVTLLGTKPAPSVAAYSSRGPSPSCPSVLKPDLMGPGSLILASWSRNSSVAILKSRLLYNDFNIISGTSMSCPHLAGVAALLKGAHPDWSPAAIRSAMMTTANTLDNTLSPIKDSAGANQLATPLAMGAGLIDPNRALDPGLIYDIDTTDYVRLLCSMNYSKEHIHTITRSPSFDCSDPSSDLNYPSFIAFVNANDSSSDAKFVKEFRRTVTNAGDGSSTYRAKVTPMEGFTVYVEPDTLVFKEKHEKQKFMLVLKSNARLNQEEVIHGYLSWIDDQGKHVVSSPIVVTTLNSEPLR